VYIGNGKLIYILKIKMKTFLENIGVHFNTFVVVLVACCSTMITVTALYFGITSQLALIQQELVSYKPVTKLTMKLATNVLQLDYLHNITPNFDIDFMK
jgi:hypothetical protein